MSVVVVVVVRREGGITETKGILRSFNPLSSIDDPSRVFVFSLSRPLSSSDVDDSARTGMCEVGDEGEGSSVEGRQHLFS